MFEGDPEEFFLSINRRDVLPVGKNGFLHPAKIDRIVDMTHLIDIAWFDRYLMLECRYLWCCHSGKMGLLAT